MNNKDFSLLGKEFHTDPSQNFIERPVQPLDPLFKPKSVALIGAKDDIGSVGRTIMANLLAGPCHANIYPVNPKRKEVLGVRAYPRIGAVPESIDLAVIVTPAHTVPAIVKECVDCKVKSVIIISAGFKEVGAEGLAMEREVVGYARSGNMPVIGPNCLGVMNPIYGLNATFAKGMALPGNIAFISQSGAMCTAVLDWSFTEQIGFSAFVSIGSMADVNWGDLIHYLGDDPQTHSILMYMETVGDPRSFLTAAREIALEKPIIVIKGGRSVAAAKAAASHTGSLTGSDEVFEAALLRAGVLRVDTISELFDMASVLSRQPSPKGPNLAIVTNAGGPSVLATDATELHGGRMAELGSSTIAALDAFLPKAWSHGNPIDILGDAGPDRYAKTVEILAKDPCIDGILVVLSPQDVTQPEATAECLRPYSHLDQKPLLASWMGGDSVAKGAHILNQAKIPTFNYPDNAAWSFTKMWGYSENLRSLYETPTLRLEAGIDVAFMQASLRAKRIIDAARSDGRTLLDEFESKEVLTCYGIPVVKTMIASNVEAALKCADKIGYPVVLKLFSKTITHKSDVGGVKLDLSCREAVVRAFEEIRDAVVDKVGEGAFEGVTIQRMVKLDGYELILGSSCDQQFGPVLLFGTGGQLVEVYKDRSLDLPPLNATLANRMMSRTKIYEALKGVRGRKPVDIGALKQILVNFSQLICENRWIKEFDINPLLVSGDEIIAVDARIVLHDPSLQEKDLPQLAIRPYPIQYITHCRLKNGIELTLRPIRAEDEPLLVAFHKLLSENSVRQRFFGFMSLSERVAHERLVRICFNDYDKEIAIVAEYMDDAFKKPQIIGVARLSRLLGTREARLTMLIADAFHGLGLGTKLMQSLIEIARNEGISQIHADILRENVGMVHLCRKLGFTEFQGKDPLIMYLKFILVPIGDSLEIGR